MWLTSLAIKRPLLILMGISALVVLGLVSWTRLGVDLFPPLNVPAVVVSTEYPGAGPEAVDSLVTQPIEDAAGGMSDIDYIQSTSTEGLSSVAIIFTDRGPQDSAVEVERRINSIRSALPLDVKDPAIGKFDPNAQPIITLSLSSSSRDLSQQQLAADDIQRQLQVIDGVAEVKTIGGLEREVQVQVDPQKLQAHALSILQVNQALSHGNLNVPAGSLSDSGKTWTVRVNTQARQPADLLGVVVARTANGPVYLRDVATVIDTTKQATTIQRTNGQVALGISVEKQAGANTVATADAIKSAVAQIARRLPSDTRVAVVSDSSVFIGDSVNAVQHELSQAVVLTALVLLLFLHSLRSTLIVLLAIPTSLIATLGVMYFLGLSLNMMSLMGLTLTVGILVDDSIVVLENIFRHLRMGETPREAALNGRSEIGFAAIAITLVDVVVFTPIAFMSGITGQYFRQFGLVIVVATLFSLLVSFTLTPMLVSRWYGTREEADDTQRGRNPLVRFGRLWDACYGRLEVAYRWLLGAALQWRWLVIGLGVLSFVAGLALAATGALSTEFIPEADNGELQVNLEMPPGTPLQVTNAASLRIEQRLLAWPEVSLVSTSVGVGGASGGSAGERFAQFHVELKPKDERARTPAELSAEARTFASDIPGARVTANPISLFAGGSSTLQVRIQGEDQQVLSNLAEHVASVVRNVPGTSDVSDGGVQGEPELNVAIDRDRAADVGLDPADVASALRSGLGGSTVTTFRSQQDNQNRAVTVILDPDQRSRVDQVPNIPILTPNGTSIRLGEIARVTPVSGPAQITRRDRRRTVFVSAGLTGERPLGDVSRDIQLGLNRIQVPAGYVVAQGGLVQSQDQSFGQIFQALGLSVLLMYMLMVALFESLLYPFIVMLSLPLAVVGAFGLLTLTGNTLNMLSLIGLILLTGLVGKNAILLVDYTNTLRKQGLGRNEALLEAGPARLRPILMTTAAMVLAMLPVALRLGDGSELRAPMAVTVIGGLLTSTLLTSVLVPCVYTLLDDLQGWLSGMRQLLLSAMRRLATKRSAEAPLPPDENGLSLEFPGTHALRGMPSERF